MTLLMSFPIIINISKQIDASKEKKFTKSEISAMVMQAFKNLDKDMEQAKKIAEGKMDKKDFKPSYSSYE